MSITLYITADPPVDGALLNRDRVALAAVLQDLTPVAEGLGVTPLEQFQSYSNHDLPEPMDEEMPVTYFDPADALLSVNALLRSLPTVRFEQSGLPLKVEEIVSELEDCRAALMEIQQAHSKFRFHIGF
jgi:hypothetical protein